MQSWITVVYDRGGGGGGGDSSDVCVCVCARVCLSVFCGGRRSDRCVVTMVTV